ncbi:MAG: hypothetical protein RIC55_24025 [Pirellulaceae bacterium]
MTADFDPYYKWLGIPPREQPPTHYRLLAIEPFEPDLDVISHAADSRMTHVRSLQSGQRGAMSQKLLNEISAARLCLLNPQTKAAYDAQLRVAQGARPAPPSVPMSAPSVPMSPLSVPMGPPSGSTPPPSVPMAAPSVPMAAPSAQVAPAAPLVNIAAEKNARPKSSFPIALVGAGVAVMLLVAAVVGAIVVMQPEQAEVVVEDPPSQTPPSPKIPNGQPKENNVDSPPVAPAGLPSLDDSVASRPATGGDGGLGPIGTPPPKPPESSTGEPPKLVGTLPPLTLPPLTPPTPATTPDDGASTETSKEPAVDAQPRLAVPESEALAKARQLVAEVYDEEIAAAEDDPRRLTALSEKMMQRANEEGEEGVDPASRFALLQRSAEVAADGGDVALAWRAYGELERRFEVRVAAPRLRMIENVAKASRPADQNKATAQQMAALVDDAAALDDFAAATALADGAVSLARKAGDRQFLVQAVAVGNQVKDLAKVYNRDVAPALAALETAPDDPAANLAVGRYLALVKGDWPRALPHLAKAPVDDTFHIAATGELDAKGNQIDAADDWYDLAQSQSEQAARNRLEVHARKLYEANVAGLSGLEKTRVEERIEQLASIAEPAGVGSSVATAPSTSSPTTPTPKVKPGQAVLVKAVGSACNTSDVRVNGASLFAKSLGREEPTTAAASLKAGDLITASISGRTDTNSLWLVFVSQDDEFLFETSTAWKSYRPPNESAWWSVDAQALTDVASAEERSTDTQYVDRVQRSVGTVLQRLPLSAPIHSTLPGPTIRDAEYVFYVVQPEDLTPKAGKLYSPSDDQGVAARPAPGQRLPVNVVAAGNSRVNVRVNGQPVFSKPATRNKAMLGRTQLREGDLIVVEIDDRFDTGSARVVFLTADGGLLFETSTDWTAFQPPEPIRWWDLYHRKPDKTAPAELRAADAQYVDEVQQSLSQALPGAPATSPVYSPLPGDNDNDPTYLYYVVTKDDLQPKR